MVIALGGYITYDKLLSNKNTMADNNANILTENNNSSDASSEQIDGKNTNNKLANCPTMQDTSVITYRFFGYLTNSSPDTYTTLKLYSNNKYDLFVNNCEGITKYSGNYTETNTNISLTGDKSLVFEKKYGEGRQLEFNFSELGACSDGAVVLAYKALY